MILGGVILLLRNIERSPLGRAWVALREDELAAQCMGLNVARLKLAAFVLSSAIAGAAGCLYAVRLTNTSDPNAYDFNRSVIILCCLILGGLGSIRGALLGAFLLVGYETILAPALDRLLQQLGASERFYGLLELSRWNLMLFGLGADPDDALPAGRFRAFHARAARAARHRHGAVRHARALMSLLTVKNLTIQFGGVTAVDSLDFSINDGQIVSLIGPNGAGKTTVFNAITGVTEPTDGIITYRGRQLARPLTWCARLACLAVGLISGIVLALLAANIDLLWKATIKRNMLAANEPFTWTEAGRDALAYVRGELAVEPRLAERWAVVSPSLNRELGEAERRPTPQR